MPVESDLVTDSSESIPESGETPTRAIVPDPQFVQEFTRSQRQIYLYILSQVPSPVDADEILQETNLVIWRKVDRFQLGTNFLAWAYQIAGLEVLKFRERRHRDRLRFSEEFIERVADEVEGVSDQLEARRLAMLACIEKLRPADRELIEERYSTGENGLSVARKKGRPANSVYQSLGRIRRALLECITRRLAAEGST
ncbi:MAG: sigma-70 family RNA polymerase sigma factor [Planctomycetaceae bacterium]|nr:sigma-70 family RNA polymerase sigma factor [Planctomycetaceae bacterium]